MSTNDARILIDPLDTPRTVRMVRHFDAPRARLYRCLVDPEELVRWFAEQIDGSLGLRTRSTLVFPDQRFWWDGITLESDRRFEFRWPWLPDEWWETTASTAWSMPATGRC